MKFREVCMVLLVSTVANAAPYRRHGLSDCLSEANVPQYSSNSTNFTQEIKPFNLRLPFTPVAVVVPTSASQVQSAVSCAAHAGVKVAAKAGGHSYASHGLGGEDGHLMVDLKYMNSVSVESDTNIATIEPGARLGTVALALFEQGNRAISHGTCPGVGSGGHILGGGYGLSSRTHGLAMDGLIEANVVLANASIVTASETQNSDLFWALRGAGPSFGIVTSFKFKTFPAPSNNTVFSYTFSLTHDEARTTYEALQTYANSTMPAAMNMRLFTNSFTSSLSGVYYGSQSDFTDAIQPLLDELPPALLSNITSMGWIDTLLANSNGPLEQPIDYDYHETFFAKSLMTKKVSPEAMDAFTAYWYNTAKKNTRDWFLIIDLHGGPSSAISKIPNSATAYPHREAILKYQLYDRIFAFGNDTAYPPDGFSFLNGWVDTITSNTPETVGMYLNYADPSLSAAQAHTAYWMDHYPKLSEIKGVVDAKNLFTNPQAVTSS